MRQLAGSQRSVGAQEKAEFAGWNALSAGNPTAAGRCHLTPLLAVHGSSACSVLVSCCLAGYHLLTADSALALALARASVFMGDAFLKSLFAKGQRSVCSVFSLETGH